MRRGTPNSIIRSIASGSAASERGRGEGDDRRILDRADEPRGAGSGRGAPPAPAPPARTRSARRRAWPPAGRGSGAPEMPLWLTVTAIAAPMPIGANLMTMPTNLNITSVSPSQNSEHRLLRLAPHLGQRDARTAWPRRPPAAPRSRAAASKKLLGTMCSRNPPNVVGRGLGDRRVGVGRRAGSRRRPGWVRLHRDQPDRPARPSVMSQK